MDSIGVVVNPIAGMGGRVGLKGTDDKVEEARRRGAEPRAPERARTALASLHRRTPDLTVYTAAGVMGEDAARDAGYEPEVVYDPWTEAGNESAAAPPTDPAAAETTAEDTQAAVRAFLEHSVDLILFVGGDGTAVDVAAVIEEHDEETPMLGVPAGVKIYSSVFAVTPRDAGYVAAEFDRVEAREVNDIDEEAYREGEVRTELQAVVPVPVAPDVQSGKQVSSGNVDSLAAGFAREVESDRTYVFGPGGTVGAIERELGIDPSPLGVDVWRDGDLLARDAAESEILEVLEDPVTIVVSPIGGQGFVFGRGNHQISPQVIERADEIEVVASGEKLDDISALRVDTDDDEVDESLRGWMQVRTGRFTTRLVKVI
ncbi:N-acetylglucosamine-1-phosphate uridyltransferase [Natronococcus pandeyae]|uniref:N-acetylglucosamine-1-phosphate uridyltransferase n=1 Tax=Natronococcus pandeyae TaxID=2055836 RepID=A0A8J8Q504_9EURY|nr:ATP-NAD kinase family protein [Natronococcus pandeyae]TYL40520.1 N-acetylglucosamine-1-phosphate uridyltransferase [Natronococcus pandeyae]